MKTFITRMVENADEEAAVYRLRYEYYVGCREIDVSYADHAGRRLSDARDLTALAYATFAGPDLVGAFRIEVGAPRELKFSADWRYGDFLDGMPEQLGLVSWLVTDPHLRDATVAAHMAEESVAIARTLDLDHVFFECCPALWPLFHRAGLKRKGGALPSRVTGVQSAVFHLERADRHTAALIARDYGTPILIQRERPTTGIPTSRRYGLNGAQPLALVSGGN